MGEKIAKHYFSHKSLLNFLKFFLAVCFQYPHKVGGGIFFRKFEILNFNQYFFLFLNM